MSAPTSTLSLSRDEVLRADHLRQLLADAETEVLTGKRKRPRAIKVGFALTEKCETPGIEGRLVAVSTTGAIFTVRDAATKQTIEVPNREITSWEVL